MATKSQDRMLGLTLVAALVTAGGELLGIPLLVTIGVASFVLAVVGLLTLMAATLVVGVNQISGPDMHDRS